MSRNEGRWRAGIQSALVGGEQELDFEEDPEGEAARGTRKGGTERRYGKTSRGNGCMRASSLQTWEPGGGQRGVWGRRVSAERARKKSASWLWAVASSRVTIGTMFGGGHGGGHGGGGCLNCLSRATSGPGVVEVTYGRTGCKTGCCPPLCSEQPRFRQQRLLLIPE